MTKLPPLVDSMKLVQFKAGMFEGEIPAYEPPPAPVPPIQAWRDTLNARIAQNTGAGKPLLGSIFSRFRRPPAPQPESTTPVRPAAALAGGFFRRLFS